MDEIVIADYDPNWVKLFEREAKAIAKVLDPKLITRIEHFGSTSIPNLPAKPIIDIIIEVKSLTLAKQKAIAPLELLSYAYWQNNPDPNRMFFVKGLPPNSPRTHHLHLVEADSILWERLLFRDYLRQHSDEAARYASLKYRLATMYTSNREAYTQSKTEYVLAITKKAKEWANKD